MRCSMPNTSTGGRVAQRVRAARVGRDRIEVALADTATYSKATAGGMHLVTLFNGRRYEGVPGQDDFRVIEFREHGIPIATPAGRCRPVHGPRCQADSGSCWGSRDPSDIAQLQFRASTPMMALVLTLIARAFEPTPAAAGPLCPGGVRHRGVLRLLELAVGRPRSGWKRATCRRPSACGGCTCRCLGHRRVLGLLREARDA